jgi:hypothetical protein
MSQEVGQTELKAKTQQLLDGPLKHIRAAAIAAALLPLASVAATPASAQGALCPSSGTLCGVVWNDTNGNGKQDAGELGIEGVSVSLYDGNTLIGTVDTGPDGVYSFFVPDGTYTVRVLSGIPLQGMQPSPPNVGPDDTIDSDGVPEGTYFKATVTLANGNNSDTDFGFTTSTVLNPGTGTPGYWKNHPEAWPVDGITVGGTLYPKAQIITWLAKVGKDKTTTIFASYVSAWLNTYIGNCATCVSPAMTAADAWLAQAQHPVGSNVAASSTAWQQIEWAHQTMDAYNNGLLCAPHRQ